MQPLRSQTLKIALVISAFILVSTGVFLLRGEITTAGWILILLGVLFFTFSTLFMNKDRPDEPGHPPSTLSKVVAVILLWISLALTGYVVARVLGPIKPGYWVGAAWLFSVVLAIISVWLMSEHNLKGISGIPQFIRSHRFEFFSLLGILIISTLLRIIFISAHPFPWSGDEASIGIEGRRILQGEITNFFDTGWSGQPNWSFIPTALSITIFGENIFAIRLPSVISGTLATIFLFLLAREMFGKRTALLAAIFLTAFPLHLHFSRIGVHNVIDSLMVCLVLWLVMLAIRKEKLVLYLFAGIATGLTFYTYVGTRLVLGIALLVLLYSIVRRRGFIRTHLPHLGIFGLGLLIAIAPMAAYFLDRTDLFMTRISQSSIFSAGWLENEASLYGISKAAVVWKQFTTTVLVYISKPAISNFFYSPRPYLTVMGAVFFLLGLAYSLLRILEPRMFMLQVWFWSVIMLGGVLTQGAPAHTRLLMTTPAVAIFLALGIEESGNLLCRTKIFTERRLWIIGILLVGIIGIQNTIYYFGEYRTENYFGDANSELAQTAGMQLSELGPEYNLYLLGNPRVYVGFPTFEFLAPDNDKFDVDPASLETMLNMVEQPSIFIAIPENTAELEQIMLILPGGRFETIDREYKEEILYYAYQVE